MAIFCGPGCIDACDFCVYFISISLQQTGVYDGDGYCAWKGSAVDPGNSCEHFCCWRARILKERDYNESS